MVRTPQVPALPGMTPLGTLPSGANKVAFAVYDALHASPAFSSVDLDHDTLTVVLTNSKRPFTVKVAE